MSDVVETPAKPAAADVAAHDTLARTVWAEARGEGRVGMEAVASVILNRVRIGGWWGHDVISVCRRPWQFSCWNANDPNRAKLLAVTGADPSFVTALAVAEEALNGSLKDATNDADSYYARTIAAPGWVHGAKFTALIGNQLFWRTV